MMNEDYLLIIRLNNGCKKSFAALYDKYVGMVYNYVCSILPPPMAEDITQFCFMQLWQRRDTISPEKNLPAWLYVIARNAVYKETRRQVVATKYVDFAIRTADEFDNSTVENMDFQFLSKEVEKIIDSLPESRRKIFLMKTVQEMSIKEISSELNISPKTVDTQVRRAMSAIQKHISGLLAVAVIVSVTV